MKVYSVTEDQLKTMAKNCGCGKEGVDTVGNIFIDCRCKELETKLKCSQSKLTASQKFNTKLVKENKELRKALEVVEDKLDNMIGDTDPDISEDWDDETIKEEEPLFWMCREINKALIATRR